MVDLLGWPQSSVSKRGSSHLARICWVRLHRQVSSGQLPAGRNRNIIRETCQATVLAGPVVCRSSSQQLSAWTSSVPLANEHLPSAWSYALLHRPVTFPRPRARTSERMLEFVSYPLLCPNNILQPKPSLKSTLQKPREPFWRATLKWMPSRGVFFVHVWTTNTKQIKINVHKGRTRGL